MKILGIDYGSKRIGLAISDETGKLASRFLTVEDKSFESLVKGIKRIISEKNIEKIIIGMPVGFRVASDQTKKTRKFVAELKKHIKIPVVEINEIFTSKMAEKNLRSAGIKDKELKNLIDQEAARIILQEYLDKINKNNENRQSSEDLD